MYILYSKEHKLVFIMFSRCWSKTMINWIGELNNIPESERNSHKKAAENKNMCLNSYNFTEILNIVDDSYKIYIMVRNPYDRLLSTTIAHKQHQHMTFKEFVFKYDNHDSIIMSHPKVLLLMNNRNNEILYFKDFKRKLQEIIVNHEIPLEIKGYQELRYNNDISKYNENIYDIKLENFTNDSIPYFYNFYNNEMKLKVYEMFKKDFINFKINPTLD